MLSLNLSSIYIAVIEVRRCQIMIGLWQYGISEMGFEVPRDVELRFCMYKSCLVEIDKA